MKNYLTFPFFLFLASICYSQNNLLFKKIQLSGNIKIACLTDHLDNFQINKRFTFYCDKKDDISDILKTFIIGNKKKQIGGSNEIYIFILRDKEIQPIQMLVNPMNTHFKNILGGEIHYLSECHSSFVHYQGFITKGRLNKFQINADSKKPQT